MTDATPEALVGQLRAQLTLERVSDDAFATADQPAPGLMGYRRVFGGQVIAQALLAAAATVPDDRPVHSLHAYFLRMGAEGEPIGYRVTRDLDGGSFANRHVVASQGERALLTMSASFHRREDGYHHAHPMPQVAAPEELTPDSQLRAANLHLFPADHHSALGVPRPIELRSVEQHRVLAPGAMDPEAHTWLRAVAPLGSDQMLHRAVLAYASDMVMMPTATLPHGLSGLRGEVREASLDHGVWFHHDVRADDWLLVHTRSGWSGNGRGFITAQMFQRDGTLVASVAQEGMIRPVA